MNAGTNFYTQNEVDALIHDIKESQQRVVIYGFTHACEMAIVSLMEYGITPNTIYDRDSKLTGITMFGIPVKQADLLYEEPKGTFIFVAVRSEALRLKSQFINEGYLNTNTVLPIIDLFDYTKYSINTHRVEYNPFEKGDVLTTVTHLNHGIHRGDSHYHNHPLSTTKDMILHGYFYEYYRVLEIFRNVHAVEHKGANKVIHMLTVAFGRKCNLRCVDCAADIQYTDSNAIYSVDGIKRSLDRLFMFINYIPAVAIGGGEPFTCRNLVEIAEIIYQHKKVGRIGAFFIVTNGGIIPEERTLRELSKYIQYIRVSDYNNLVKKREAFMLKARQFLPVTRVFGEYEIDHEANLHEVETLWSDIGDFTPRKRNPEQLKEISDKCIERNQFILDDGKLYNCWRSNSCMKFGVLEENPSECADLLNTALSDDELARSIEAVTNIYGTSTPALRACNYCDGVFTSDKRVAAGIQVGHKLSLYEKTENPAICSPVYDVRTYVKERLRSEPQSAL